MALANTLSSTTSIYENKDLSPYQRFVYALRAPESKRQYPKRLQIFLDYLKIQGLTIEEKADKFYLLIEEKGLKWLEHELLKFFRLQNQRAERNEISTETIKNYLKPVKLFCEMNDIEVKWKKITLGLPKERTYAGMIGLLQ